MELDNVNEFFTNWIFPLKRPRLVPHKRESLKEEREKFKNTVKEKILDKNNEVLFFDEAFFKRETTITRAWYLKGSRPEIIREPSYQKIGVYSAVNPRNGKLFSMIDSYFDSEGVRVYLELLLKSKKNKKKIVLVLDNAAPHKAKTVKDFVKAHNDKIEFLYLPPYSPDLQPAEMIWKALRKDRTHNTYFPDIGCLLNKIEDYLKVYSKKNRKFQNLCRFNYVA